MTTTPAPVPSPTTGPPPPNGEAREGSTPPVQITFVLWDAESDGVAILHDGVQVWAEPTFDRLDQYLRFYAPIGKPVLIDYVTGD